jgi:hypothetical protein
MSEYTKSWAFKHPSPWDYIFFMNNELKQDLNWFWYYVAVDDGFGGWIDRECDHRRHEDHGDVRQAGQMPAPVVLRVQLAASGRRFGRCRMQRSTARRRW